jgi:hypothetical protein
LIYKILLLLIFSTHAFAFDKNFKTVNERVPLEFVYLFESMKLEVKTPLERIQLVGICKELDENLGFLEKQHIFLLMKSEVMKNILEYKHSKVRSFDVTTFLVDRLEEDFSKKQKFLNSFSQWLWRSILAELKHRKDMGLITAKSFNVASFDGPKRLEAQRFDRYLTYLLPWIDKMDALSAPEFNELSREVSWVILKRLNQRSLLFKRFASTAATDTKVTIFNIPGKLLDLQPEDIKRIQSNTIPMSLKEESELEKTQATKQVQGATPDDLSPLSDELSKELDQKAP